MGGCAIVVDGLKTDEGKWQSDGAEIRRRAAFELHCSEPLKLTLLKTEGFAPPIPWVIGVEGCGRQAVYQVVYGTGWVLNSEATHASR
jgi:hypothetical protein